MTQPHPHVHPDPHPPVHHRDHHVLAVVTAAIVAVWVILPPASVRIDDGCRPDGIQATVSALVTQGWFWDRQLTAVKAERDRLIALQNRNGTGQDPDRVNPIESRMDRLSRENDPHDTSEDAQQAWLQTLQTDRIARIAMLMKCADRIERGGRGG